MFAAVLAHPQQPVDTTPQGGSVPTIETKQTLDDLINQIFVTDPNQPAIPQPTIVAGMHWIIWTAIAKWLANVHQF